MLYTDIPSGYRQVDEASYSDEAEAALNAVSHIARVVASLEVALEATRKAIKDCDLWEVVDVLEAGELELDERISSLRAKAEDIRWKVANGEFD